MAWRNCFLQTLYLDGEVAGMLVAPTSLLMYTTCGLGYVSGWPNLTGPNSYLTGKIDDVRVYNRVLSNSEIWKLGNP